MDNIRQTFTDASSLLSKAVKDANIHDEASVVFNRAKQVKYFLSNLSAKYFSAKML